MGVKDFGFYSESEERQLKTKIMLCSLIIGIIAAYTLKPQMIELTGYILTSILIFYVSLIGWVILFGVFSGVWSQKDSASKLPKVFGMSLGWFTYTTIICSVIAIACAYTFIPIFFNNVNLSSSLPKSATAYPEIKTALSELKTWSKLIGLKNIGYIHLLWVSALTGIIFVFTPKNATKDKIGDVITLLSDKILNLMSAVSNLTLPLVLVSACAYILGALPNGALMIGGGLLGMVLVMFLCKVVHHILFLAMLIKKSPKDVFGYLCVLMPALITAFLLRSSAAALASTQKTLRDKLHIDNATVGVTTSLGATVNMDMTTMVVVSAPHIAYFLSFGKMMPIDGSMIKMSFDAIAQVAGVAGAPGGSVAIANGLIDDYVLGTAAITIVNLAALSSLDAKIEAFKSLTASNKAVLLNEVGFSAKSNTGFSGFIETLEGIKAFQTVYLAVDQISDMFRSAGNVLGDSFAAIFVFYFGKRNEGSLATQGSSQPEAPLHADTSQIANQEILQALSRLEQKIDSMDDELKKVKDSYIEIK